jgi:hypothetical protein
MEKLHAYIKSPNRQRHQNRNVEFSVRKLLTETDPIPIYSMFRGERGQTAWLSRLKIFPISLEHAKRCGRIDCAASRRPDVCSSVRCYLAQYAWMLFKCFHCALLPGAMCVKVRHEHAQTLSVGFFLKLGVERDYIKKMLCWVVILLP